MAAYKQPTIEGVQVKELKVIPDERGRLMEILRADDEIFTKFGQVYMTSTLPGVVKAWHQHHRQLDNIACVFGTIKLGLYDDRSDSPTRGALDVYYLGRDNPILVQVPRFVYHGWKCVSVEEALIVNTVTETYDYTRPDEYRLDAHDNDIIPKTFTWARQDG